MDQKSWLFKIICIDQSKLNIKDNLYGPEEVE